MSQLRVLMYHKVAEEPDFLTVTPAQFEKQLIIIKSKYTAVRLSEVIEHIQTKKALPKNALLISFDDGYADNYTQAYPLLKQYNLPFCIFLVSDFVGQTTIHDSQSQQFLSIKQLQEMNALAEYACHSTNHQNINDIPVNEWEHEIGKCYDNLKASGLNIQTAWAYTYGAFPKKEASKMALLEKSFQKNGITCSFRIGNRINALPLKKPYSIERLDIRGDQPLWRFRLKLLMGKII
ncbi:MAG: polysaccharide deacetylase family protein [Chitinophagaceae bacterium]